MKSKAKQTTLNQVTEARLKKNQEKRYEIPVKKLVKRILEINKGNWKDTYLTWICVLIETVAEVLVAFFLQYLIDGINALNTTNNLTPIFVYSGGILALAIIAAATGIIAGVYAASASAGFGRNLRREIFMKIQTYSFENIDKFSTSSIVTRTTTDVTNVQNAFLMVIRSVIRAPIMMIFALIMCLITKWELAMIFLALIPITLGLLILIASKAHPIFERIFNHYDMMNENVEEDVEGIRAVKSFNRENTQVEIFKDSSNFINNNFIKAESLLSFNAPIMDFASYSAMLLLSYFGAWIIVKKLDTSFTVGSLTTLITYIMMILIALMMISTIYVMLIISRNSAERIIELIDEKPVITNCENPIYEIRDGQIDFDNVTFAYNNDKPVLENIDLHLKSGETLGIIGPTGSSKTTLISLIARLYDATSGDIKVGGVNVKNYDIVSLRNACAVVLQKNTLFTGTIRSNLLFGNKDATDEQLYDALKLSEAYDFVMSFKEGLDHPISEGGNNVSGGQKQRLCIARALLKNPKILILDDTTSACDTHTDALIRANLALTKPEVTKLIISQRVSSIKDCDKIIVLEKGKIIASGNNDELMNNCPIYKELYESQLGGGDFDAQD